jgi:hypothetical protein
MKRRKPVPHLMPFTPQTIDAAERILRRPFFLSGASLDPPGTFGPADTGRGCEIPAPVRAALSGLAPPGL